MADATITIFFAGLIAFAPESIKTPVMTAYLLDNAHHNPEIVIPKGGFEQCPTDKAVCETNAKGACVCNLSGRDVVMDPVLKGTLPSLSPVLPGVLPSKKNGQSLSWLVRLQNTSGNGKIDKGKAWNKKVSMIEFEWDSGFTCAFDEIEFPQTKFWVLPMWFRPGTHVQAVAEAVGFVARMAAGKREVVLRKNAQDEVRVALKCPDDKCPPLTISNATDDACAVADCHDGEHFAHFYDIIDGHALSSPPVPTRIPFVPFPSSELEFPRCKGFAVPIRPSTQVGFPVFDLKSIAKGKLKPMTVGSKVICPMAMLEPATQ